MSTQSFWVPRGRYYRVVQFYEWYAGGARLAPRRTSSPSTNTALPGWRRRGLGPLTATSTEPREHRESCAETGTPGLRARAAWITDEDKHAFDDLVTLS
jgi:hypothetical protein